jgi:hypothetical protein
MDATRKKQPKTQWRDQQQTPDEWYQCMSAGTCAVRRPTELRQFRRPGAPRLTIYHIPSFQDCYGWTVYQMRGERHYKLQTVIWRQHADGQRIQDLRTGRIMHATAEPTLDESIADIDAQQFEERMATLATIRIPLVIKRPVGCDGESFGVRIEREFELEWWCNGPAEWAELERWTYDCIEMFRRAAA